MVIEFATLIEVVTVLFVIQGAGERVLFVPGDVTVSHDNNLISWNAHFQIQVVGVAHVSLMSIVVETFGACHEDGPVVFVSFGISDLLELWHLLSPTN